MCDIIMEMNQKRSSAMKIYLDDQRNFPHIEMHYSTARTYEECLQWIDYCHVGEVTIENINLDYDLGTSKTGLDVLKYLHEKQIIPETITIHSTHYDGVREMEKYIKQHFKESKYNYNPSQD